MSDDAGCWKRAAVFLAPDPFCNLKMAEFIFGEAKEVRHQKSH